MKLYFALLILVVFLTANCDSFLENRDKLSLIKLTNEPGNQEKPRFSNDGSFMAYNSNEFGSWQVFLYNFETKVSKQITDGSGSKKNIKWSPDDKFITFTEGLENQSRIAIINTEILTTKYLTEWNQNASNANWSPDGDKLVIDIETENKGIWLLDLSTGKQSQLTDFEGNETNFGFSFDGKWIGYSPRGSTTRHLQALNLESNETRQLIHGQDGFEWLPRWSEKTLEVSFYSTWNGEMTDIWLTDLVSGDLQRITNQNIEEFGPTLNRNTNRVAYFSHDGAMNVMIHNLESKQAANLELQKEVIVIWDPMAWSPNQDYLAFSATTEYTQIHKLSIIDDEDQRLIPDRLLEHQFHPIINQSGERIAYNNQKHEIILFDTVSKEIQIIPPINEHHVALFPSWIPDQSNKLCFIYGEGGATDTNNLWMIDLLTNQRSQITEIGGINRPYCWINSELVAFSHDPTTSYSNYQIWMHNLSTGKSKELLKDEKASLFPTDSYGGDKLLFYGKIKGANQIYEYSISSGKYFQVETGMKTAKWGQYSPDGLSIAFVSSDNIENFPDIYVFSRNELKTERLTNSREEESNIRWLDGNQLIFQFTKSNQDIYMVDVNKRLEELQGE